MTTVVPPSLHLGSFTELLDHCRGRSGCGNTVAEQQHAARRLCVVRVMAMDAFAQRVSALHVRDDPRLAAILDDPSSDDAVEHAQRILHLSVEDAASQQWVMEAFLEPAVRFIWARLHGGCTVFVHCAMGVSRSVTVVVAAVMCLPLDTEGNFVPTPPPADAKPLQILRTAGDALRLVRAPLGVPQRWLLRGVGAIRGAPLGPYRNPGRRHCHRVHRDSESAADSQWVW